MRTNCFTILRFPGGVIKRLCLVLVLALSAGLSLNAQTTWYSPGTRLGIDEINAGDVVFIYSMCYVNGNASSDYSRFIVNDGNSAKAGVGKPATLKTSNIGYVWKVRSKENVQRTVTEGTNSEEVTYTGVQLTFSRNAGSEGTTYYWGIGGITNNSGDNMPENAQKMVVTQWTKAPYVSGTSKSGDDVYWEAEDGTITSQSSMTETDKVYLVSALTGISVNTSNGVYNSDRNNGYPVAFYSVTTSQEAPADPLGIHVSAAPVSDTGTTVWNDDTKWYKLKTNSGSWRYVDTNHAYCDASGNFQLNKTASSDALSALWAVEGNETEGYKFYNMATGPGKVLGVTGSEQNARTKMVDKDNPGNGVTTAFDIAYHYDGNWYIKKHGTANEYLNYRNGNLALWDSSDGLGNDGSAFKFEAVDNVTAFVTAAQTKIVGRAEDWKNMPAIWAGATATYDALNGVTLSTPVTNAEIVAVAEAQAAAGNAFVVAVNNQKVTLTNYDRNSAQTDRHNAAMYVSATVKGRTTATITMDEVMVLKANPDFTIKIYNASANKYVGTPQGTNSGTTSAVALANAATTEIYTEASKGPNVAVFCVNGTATMHLLGNLNISGYSSTTDEASFWRFSTDLSRYELKAGIENATAWKNNLSTLIAAKKANLLQEPASLYKITEEIRYANLALNDASGTQATRTAALATLNAALTKAQGAWLGELGATQEFRLRNNAITTTTGEGETTSYYLIVGQEKNSDNEGNARLAELDENSATSQKFTLTPGTGNNAGKYVLTFGDRQLKDLGYWNTDMTTSGGTPYTFEEVNLAEGLFRIRTTQGLFGPNNGVTGNNLTTNNNKFMYTNHTGTRDNLTWALEFIAPVGAADKTALAAEIAKSRTWLDDANLINPDGIACVVGYKAEKEAAETVNNNDAATRYEVNTALQHLKAKWDILASRLFAEASPAQGYRLKFNSDANLYMTFTPDVTETHEVNVMNVQAASNAAKQTVKIQLAAEAGKFTIQDGATSKNVGIGSNYWNPSLVDAAGATFTFEPVTLDNSDYLAVKIKTIHGVLAPSSDAPAANAYVYTDQGSDVARYWIVEPYVSPDSVNALKATIANIDKYVGSGMGQYASTIDVPALHATSWSMINGTDAYATSALTNKQFVNQIAQYDNVLSTTNLTINQPTAGRVYRFKGKVSGKYMCAATATPSDDTMMTMVTDSTQLGTLFILQTGEEIDGQTGFKFLSYNTGYYTKNTHNNGALSAAANSVKVYASETAANLGFYTLKANRTGNTVEESKGTYLYDYGTKASPVVDRNGSYAANNCDWTIEEVTELPISVTTGYSRLGTIVSPVSLNADNSKLKFYTGSINGDYLHLTEFTGDVIPAGVPFLIEYQGGDQTNGCSLLEVNGSEATLDGGVENALRGGLETVATPTDIGTIYTIQKTGSAPETDTQVFRRYTGDTVKGCRAYLPLPADSNIKGMVFDDGTTTEIETLVEPAAPVTPAACYDLSGRRVAKAAKGLYIRDGKKIYVK